MATVTSEQEQCRAMAVTSGIVLALLLAILTILLGFSGFAMGAVTIFVTAAGLISLEHSGWGGKHE